MFWPTSSPAHLFAITGRRKNHFSFKLFWGRGCCFGMNKTEGTAPYISLKIPGSFARLFFQSSFEWLHMEVT